MSTNYKSKSFHEGIRGHIQQRRPKVQHAGARGRRNRRGGLWAKKDLGSWSIAKGEYEEGEAHLQAELRKFSEETGYRLPGAVLATYTAQAGSGKLVDAWATESDWNPSRLVSNTFSMEWPKDSGRVREFPEVDR